MFVSPLFPFSFTTTTTTPPTPIPILPHLPHLLTYLHTIDLPYSPTSLTSAPLLGCLPRSPHAFFPPHRARRPPAAIRRRRRRRRQVLYPLCPAQDPPPSISPSLPSMPPSPLKPNSLSFLLKLPMLSSLLGPAPQLLPRPLLLIPTRQV